MAKENNGDITRLTLNVYNLENSETIMRFSDAELGQWLRLFCKAVSIAKECTLPDDRKLLQSFVKTKLSPAVLDAFPVIAEGHLAGRRRNDVQYTEWLRVKGRSELATVSASVRNEPDPSVKPLKSTNQSCERIANAEQPLSERVANITKQNTTEQNNTKEGVGYELERVQADSRPKEFGVDLCGRRRGEPGYFERGQYPGTDPKKIFKFMQVKWCDVKGESAHARYPDKYPGPWIDLCGSKSSDLIVPAFELWCHKQGRHMSTAWPVSEFLRVAEEFMSQVIPLNTAQPKLTKEIIDETYKVAAQQHSDFWTPDKPATEQVSEPGADALFTEEAN